MNSPTKSHAAPEGWNTITPRIVVQDSKGFVDFLRQVFDATGDYLESRPSVIRIGDSLLMISEPIVRNTMTAFLYVYVDDAEAVYRRAVKAGAHSVEEPVNTPYGDRRCMVEDPWGNTWQIATTVK